jgi:zinc transporter ZupT
MRHTGQFAALAVVAHNIPECFVVFGAAAADPLLGLALGAAVIAHSIPLGIAVACPFGPIDRMGRMGPNGQAEQMEQTAKMGKRGSNGQTEQTEQTRRMGQTEQTGSDGRTGPASSAPSSAPPSASPWSYALLAGLVPPVAAIALHGVMRSFFSPARLELFFACAGGIMVSIAVAELIPSAAHYGGRFAVLRGWCAGVLFMSLITAFAYFGR